MIVFDNIINIYKYIQFKLLMMLNKERNVILITIEKDK